MYAVYADSFRFCQRLLVIVTFKLNSLINMDARKKAHPRNKFYGSKKDLLTLTSFFKMETYF